MEVILGLIILVLDIIAILSILKSGYEPLKKILWILLVLILPVIGMIIWFLLGNSKRIG